MPALLTGNLVHALYRMEHEYSNTCCEHICIGQGVGDKFIDGIGIGRCCNWPLSR